MKNYIEDRVTNEAIYTIQHNSTVRATAKAFNTSKSTIHKDLTDRLSIVNPFLYKEVSTILQINKAERAYRGGKATQEKYLLMKKNSPL